MKATGKNATSKSSPLSDNNEATNPEFDSLLDKLGLREWHPNGITLDHVRSVQTKQQADQVSWAVLPWMILRKLTLMDYRCRDDLITKVNQNRPGLDKTSLDFMYEEEDEDKNKPCPLDIQLAIFLCCDPMLKQTLAEKMFVCRLALPVILQQPKVTKTLEYFLWSLSSIVMSWRSSEGKASEAQLAQHEMSFVSFIRLGSPNCSKSKLLNHILYDKGHNTFFHKECHSDSNKKTIARGLIEIAAFLPRDRSTDIFSNEMIFMNLRGDGYDYQQQMELMFKVSTVVVILLDIDDVKDPSTLKMLAKCNEYDIKLILHFVSGRLNVDLKKDVKPYLDSLNLKESLETKAIKDFTKNIFKTSHTIKLEMRTNIKTLVQSQTSNKRSFKYLAEVCTKKDIICDHLADFNCPIAYKSAEHIAGLVGNKDIVRWKKETLPLQGEVWHQWSVKQKTVNRLGKKSWKSDISKESHALVTDMNHLRQKQVTFCTSLSPDSIIRSMTDYLVEYSRKETILLHYFLIYLKTALNQISRDTLPPFQQELQTLRITSKRAINDATQHKIDELERRIVESSFGLEHLFREIAQYYEAHMGYHDKKNIQKGGMVSELPEIAAKLILKGYPFELMDGDAAAVPNDWVQAVLKSLKTIVGDKKLCILAVIGIQSSGKSTLLNTMFGLSFAVSAGRCTRGIYAQLLKMDTFERNHPFDYIMVLDSEGLRAPEMGRQMFQHDNELATLLIGLADLTLVNLYGENTAEIQDVLQIVVHAFLRMKRVDTHKQRKCIFVHQNVAAIDARERLSSGQYKMQEELNMLTHVAAAEEGKEHTFNDVIDFDVAKHVYFISPLWTGNPPMDPINPSYSEDVAEVRSGVLQELDHLNECASFTDFRHFIQNLWHDILTEEFVFSFRNSLDARAYKVLDTKTYHIIQELSNAFITWRKNAYEQLQVCKTNNDIHTCVVRLDKELTTKASKLIRERTGVLKKFVNDKKNVWSMQRWYDEKKGLIKDKGKSFLALAQSDIIRIKVTRVAVLEAEKSIGKYKDDIIKKANELAESANDQLHPNINEEFEKLWKGYNVQAPPSTNIISILIAMKSFLRMSLPSKSHKKEIEAIIGKFMKPWDEKHLALTKTFDDVAKHEVSQKKGVLKTMWLNWDDNKEVVIVNINSYILRPAEELVLEISRGGSQYDSHYFCEIMEIVRNGFETMEGKSLKFNDVLQTKLTCHVFCFAAFKLNEANETYEKSIGFKTHIDIIKMQALDLFRTMFQSRFLEIEAVRHEYDSMACILGGIIHRLLQIKIPTNTEYALEKCRDRKKYGKSKLISNILTSVVENNEFQKGMSYTMNLTYLADSVNDFFHREYSLLITQKLDTMRNNIRISIDTAAKQLTTHNMDSITWNKEWVRGFATLLKTYIPLSVEDFNKIIQNPLQREPVRLDHLKRVIEKNLGVVKEQLTSRTETVSLVHEDKYYELFDDLWGCKAQCPFCREPCLHTMDGHDGSHICLVHRPCGLANKRYRSNLIMTLSCNALVGTELYYACNCVPKCQANGDNIAGGQNCHKYKQYKRYYPEWYIPASPDKFKFWMWFMFNFKNQIEEYYKGKMPKLPPEYAAVTKEQAIKSLGIYEGTTV